MSHTAGPWKTIRPGHGAPGSRKFSCVQIGADEAYTTLEMLPDDARLIAAAPELLDACKATLHRLNNPLLDTTLFDDVKEQIVAAIAKAEGRL